MDSFDIYHCVVLICNDKLQLINLNISKMHKDFMKREFSGWYSSIAYQNFTASKDENPPPVELRMSIMKPLGDQWLIKAQSHLQTNCTIVANGFKAAEITDILP